MKKERTGEVVWQCSGCKTEKPPTAASYMSLIRAKEHRHGKIQLIDKGSGEVVARHLGEAQARGYIPIKSKPLEERGEGEHELGGEGKEQEKEPKGPKGQKGIARPLSLLEARFKADTVELDPRLKDYYVAYIEEGLIDPKTSFSNFLLGCVETLFRLSGRAFGVIRYETEEREGEHVGVRAHNRAG